MPWGLKRFQEARCLHFLTFSCYDREPRLGTPHARDIFEQTFERARKWYGFYVAGYVVMPEHVHLLVTEPERAKLSTALQMLKQNVARQLREVEGGPFWQDRYYDFNVWSEDKRIEKLRYIHRNPVRRGLVSSPELWAWSSFRHYLSGDEGVVEIESQWTARKRELDGETPRLRVPDQNPRPIPAKNAGTRTGHQFDPRSRALPVKVKTRIDVGGSIKVKATDRARPFGRLRASSELARRECPTHTGKINVKIKNPRVCDENTLAGLC